MDQTIKLAVLIENNKNLRDDIIARINNVGIPKIMECKSPCNEHRQIMTSNKSGLLVIGNDHKTSNGLGLIKFCRTRLINWTILVLDHLNSADSAAEAFAAGADDVLHIPVSEQEFNARLKLRLQQAAHIVDNDKLDIKNTLANANLTQTELDIVNLLITNDGKVVTRNQLSQHIENRDWVYGDRKYDVHIANIRNKLKDNLEWTYIVKSVRSVGYFIKETNIDNESMKK